MSEVKKKRWSRRYRAQPNVALMSTGNYDLQRGFYERTEKMELAYSFKKTDMISTRKTS